MKTKEKMVQCDDWEIKSGRPRSGGRAWSLLRRLRGKGQSHPAKLFESLTMTGFKLAEKTGFHATLVVRTWRREIPESARCYAQHQMLQHYCCLVDD